VLALLAEEQLGGLFQLCGALEPPRGVLLKLMVLVAQRAELAEEDVLLVLLGAGLASSYSSGKKPSLQVGLLV